MTNLEARSPAFGVRASKLERRTTVAQKVVVVVATILVVGSCSRAPSDLTALDCADRKVAPPAADFASNGSTPREVLDAYLRSTAGSQFPHEGYEQFDSDGNRTTPSGGSVPAGSVPAGSEPVVFVYRRDGRALVRIELRNNGGAWFLGQVEYCQSVHLA